MQQDLPRWLSAALVIAGLLAGQALGEDAAIKVSANNVLHTISRTMTGACIEDVNHEMYGGIYSQMVFGESFQEPPLVPTNAIGGFLSHGGYWTAEDNVLTVEAGDGPKLVADKPEIADGQVGVEVFFADAAGENAGLIAKLAQVGEGADNFIGYEFALNPKTKTLRVGRHQKNFELMADVPCAVPLNKWISLVATFKGRLIEVAVDGRRIYSKEDTKNGLRPGQIGLRSWQQAAKFRNLWVNVSGQKVDLPFVEKNVDRVSNMWRAVRRGNVQAKFSTDRQKPLLGVRSQHVTFVDGQGEVGVDNQGLDRWGMSFQAGKPYEGYVWVKTEADADIYVALESGDGKQIYAETRLPARAGDWQRLDFELTPNATDKNGRFTIKLKQPGTMVLGHAFLQPGPWGRFKGLPVRKDVGDALVAQGLTVLRMGGCMANAPEYRWKKMIGPRDRREPYKGFWYAHTSNGWGILDFLNFCEAAGIVGVPDFNMGESPQDMADFIEYVNGPADSRWGKRRVADGHPEPYGLKVLQLGNEECVNENYWKLFKPMAEAIWAKDKDIVLVVGDFLYSEPIKDPYKFTGAPNINTLAPHKKILELAKQHGREVWFDVHIGTETPRDWQGLRGVPSFIEALGKICPGAKYKVVVFEYNSNKHDLGRALGNARATNELERLGEHRVPIACSANCLQPYRQNDNGWDQGLLFLSPSQVWPQPPYFVTQMISRNYLPKCVRADVKSPNNSLDVTAKTGEDGKTLQIQVVNLEGKPMPAQMVLEGFVPTSDMAKVVQLSGNLADRNSPEQPNRVAPKESQWRHELREGRTGYTFPPYSFTIIRFE